MKLINGKPFATKGVFRLHISEFTDKVDKVISVVRDDNSVFKFRMLVDLKADSISFDRLIQESDLHTCNKIILPDKRTTIELQFIYMNEEPINAKITIHGTGEGFASELN